MAVNLIQSLNIMCNDELIITQSFSMEQTQLQYQVVAYILVRTIDKRSSTQGR